MSGRKPDFKVLTSRDGQDAQGNAKSWYVEVGAAWKVNGDGISIQLHCLPVDGRLIMFPREEKEQPPAATVAPVKRK